MSGQETEAPIVLAARELERGGICDLDPPAAMARAFLAGWILARSYEGKPFTVDEVRRLIGSLGRRP